MNYKVKDSFKQQLQSDLDNKYLAQGVRLGGSIKDNKVKLYTTDGHGKHSEFAARAFYGKLDGNILSGKFSVSHYVLILLGVLTAFCIESIVAALISKSIQSIIFPSVIIIIEIIYLLSLKRISAENDRYIKKYIEDNTIED